MNVPFKNYTGRQWPLYALIDVDFSNIQDTGVPVGIKLPPKAVVIDGAIDVIVASDATSSSLAIGDAANGSRYGNNINLKTTGRTPLTLTDYEDLSGADMLLLPTTSGTPTMGTFRIYVGYLIVDRANEAQTN